MSTRLMVLRFGVSTAAALYLAYIGIYAEQYRDWPRAVGILVTVCVLAAGWWAANSDIVTVARSLGRSELELLQKSTQIEQMRLEHSAEVGDFRRLLISFVDKGLFFSDNIRELLTGRAKYVCVAKSSEGLSEVFTALQRAGKGQPLPFTQILSEIPGALRPFERMDMFLIPVRSIPHRRGASLRHWMNRKILPAVRARRKDFLAELPRNIARLAEEEAYKFVAFYIDSESLIADQRCRKFNKDFVTSLLGSTSDSDLKPVKAEFADYIRAKDLALRMEWHLLVRTNRAKLLEAKRSRISEELRRTGLSSLSDLRSENAEKLATALKKATGRALTPRTSLNLANKLIGECDSIRRTLAQAGIVV